MLPAFVDYSRGLPHAYLNPLHHSRAGALAPDRAAHMMNTVFGENKNILELSSKDGAALNQLHDPRVSLHLPPYSHHPSQQQQPLPVPTRMHLSTRLRHIPPSEGPSTHTELLTNFLAEASKGTLRQRKIKDWEEWMTGMRESALYHSIHGPPHMVSQVWHYTAFMTDLKEKYGWPAAEFYWYELQKQVENQFHSLEHGPPFNPSVMFLLQESTSRYQGGQDSAATATAAASSGSSAATAATTKKHEQKRIGGGGPRGSTTRLFQCEYHGTNSTHSSAQCKVLLNPFPSKFFSAFRPVHSPSWPVCSR